MDFPQAVQQFIQRVFRAVGKGENFIGSEAEDLPVSFAHIVKAGPVSGVSWSAKDVVGSVFRNGREAIQLVKIVLKVIDFAEDNADFFGNACAACGFRIMFHLLNAPFLKG
ncbi:MAG: hypothetical protein ACK4OI_01400 [Rhizobium oryzihabitans]